MLFVPIKFRTHIRLSPSELDSKYQERIYEKLRETYEGVCTKYGYIKPSSIQIVKRSYGNFVKEHFNGYIKFEVICRAEVCNPMQGTVVVAHVKNKNQLGILAESVMEMDDKKIPILDIIIPIKSAGIISQINLEGLSIGDAIHVEVMGKKYQMKDKKISIIGRVIASEEEEEEEIPEEQEVDAEQEEEVYDLQDGGDLEEEEEDEDEDAATQRKKRVVLAVEEEEEEEEEKSEEEEENQFEEDFYDDEEEGFDDTNDQEGFEEY